MSPVQWEVREVEKPSGNIEYVFFVTEEQLRQVRDPMSGYREMQPHKVEVMFTLEDTKRLATQLPAIVLEMERMTENQLNLRINCLRDEIDAKKVELERLTKKAMKK